MSTNYNATNGLTEIIYNGTSLTSMFYNGVEVFSKTVATTLGLFYGGFIPSGFFGDVLNRVTRINISGALVGSETNVGVARNLLTGATVGVNGLFYGGETTANVNTVTRIDSNGALVGSQTNVGTARYALAGAGL